MRIVIEGAGEIGSHLAKMLSSATNEVTVIDSSEERLDRLASNADIITIVGRYSSIKAMKEARVEKSDLFIGVNPAASQDMNIVSALLAKRLGCPRVCARINDEDYLSYENKHIFTEMGLDLMFYPEKISALEIADHLKHSGSVEAMDFARGKLQIAVFKLEEDSPILDLKLAEFSAVLSGVQFRVVAISRDNKTMMPRYDTVFKYHDIVYLIAKREDLPAITQYLGKNSIEVNNVMILGGGSTAEMLAKAVSPHLESIKIIEKDLARCEELNETTPKNVYVVNGNGRDSDFLLEESIKKYDAFVSLTESDEANILACLAAKKFGIPKTIAKVENIEYIHLAEEIGVDHIINKKLLSAAKIFKLTLSSRLRLIRYMSGTQTEVLEYIVAEDSPITKKPLKDIVFPANAVVGGVIRGGEAFIAVGDTRIETYDRVAVFALQEAVAEVDKLFRSEHEKSK